MVLDSKLPFSYLYRERERERERERKRGSKLLIQTAEIRRKMERVGIQNKLKGKKKTHQSS